MSSQFSREKYELFLLQMFSRLRLLSMTGTNCTINKQMNSIYNIWQLRLTSCFWSLREDVCFSVFRKCFHEHFARCFGVLGVIPVPGPRFCCSGTEGENWVHLVHKSPFTSSIYATMPTRNQKYQCSWNISLFSLLWLIVVSFSLLLKS